MGSLGQLRALGLAQGTPFRTCVRMPGGGALRVLRELGPGCQEWGAEGGPRGWELVGGLLGEGLVLHFRGSSSPAQGPTVPWGLMEAVPGTWGLDSENPAEAGTGAQTSTLDCPALRGCLEAPWGGG